MPDLSKRPTMEKLYHSRYSDDDYDADDLIKASKWEKMFGSYFDNLNTMEDPEHPMLRHHKAAMVRERLSSSEKDSR